MSYKCILTIDAGTTSVKISLFTQELELLHCSVQEYCLCAKGDYVEAAADVYINAICAGVCAVQRAVPQCDIEAIVITTQGETMALFDTGGVPLTPFIVWLDSRATDCAAKISAKISAQSFYEETGLPEINGALPLAKAMWLRENEPLLYSRADKIMLLEDYLLYRLTGNTVSEKSIQTSTGWFSLKTDGYWKEALAVAGINEAILPELCESGTAVGTLTRAGAELLNLPEGITVVAGAMDQTAAAVSAGCIGEGVVCETTGTALVMTACTEKPVFESAHRVTIYRHALSGLYLYLPIGNTAGMALKWFRDEFGTKNAGYNEMDELAETAQEGCGGLVFLPYLAGSVDPDSCTNAKGVFYGATLATKKADFARSIFEAVGFMLKDFIEMLKPLGVEPERVISLGGGSRSALWQQIKADICGMPFQCAQCSEAASRGSALLALWGAGLLPRGEMPQHQSSVIYEPNESTKCKYNEAYSLYKRLYEAVKPLYEGGNL